MSFNKSYQVDNDVIEIRPTGDGNFYPATYVERKPEQFRQINYEHPSYRPPSYNSINRSDSAKYYQALNYQNYPMYNNNNNNINYEYYSNKCSGYESKQEQRSNDYYYSYYQTPKEEFQSNYNYDYQQYPKFRSANYELSQNQIYGVSEPVRQQVYTGQQIYTDNFKSNDFISYNNVENRCSNNFTDPNVFLNSCVSSSSSSSEGSESWSNSALLASGDIVMPDELIAGESFVSEETKSNDVPVVLDETRENSEKLRAINEDELNESEKLAEVNCYFSLADCYDNLNPIDLLMQDVQKQQLELNF